MVKTSYFCTKERNPFKTIKAHNLDVENSKKDCLRNMLIRVTEDIFGVTN